MTNIDQSDLDDDGIGKVIVILVPLCAVLTSIGHLPICSFFIGDKCDNCITSPNPLQQVNRLMYFQLNYSSNQLYNGCECTLFNSHCLRIPKLCRILIMI